MAGFAGENWIQGVGHKTSVRRLMTCRPLLPVPYWVVFPTRLH
jgi:hypothetical protein